MVLDDSSLPKVDDQSGYTHLRRRGIGGSRNDDMFAVVCLVEEYGSSRTNLFFTAIKQVGVLWLTRLLSIR